MNITKTLASMTNVKPNDDRIKRMEYIRKSYKNVVFDIDSNCKENDMTEEYISEALKLLEKSLMYAIKAIALEDVDLDNLD
ncbi:MAG: hypothetical protein WC934_07570 [Acidithiobacillus sp.]|uniref:hypothetical protein n=1 Tax=Acidithiobacillus sp. TaxID=1872118 RepID=UPI0035605C88